MKHVIFNQHMKKIFFNIFVCQRSIQPFFILTTLINLLDIFSVFGSPSADGDVLSQETWLRLDRYESDIAGFEIGPLLESTNECWTVMEFHVESVHETDPVPSIAFNADGDEIPLPSKYKSMPPQIRTVIGSYKAVAELIGPPLEIKNGTYKVPMETNGRRSAKVSGNPRGDRTKFDEQDADFSPLIEGGVGICRVNQGEEEKPTRFRPLYAIPSSWREYVLPAIKYFQEKPNLLEVKLALENQKALIGALDHENPFIAASAFRTLLKAHLLPNDLKKKIIASSTGLQQMILMKLVLDGMRGSPTKEFIQELSQIVVETNQADHVWGIGFVMKSLRSSETIRLKEALVKKASVWGVKTQADKNLEHILSL